MTTPEDRLRSELAALADLPMPPDVADRIERATAREQLSTNGPAREQLSTNGPAREQPSTNGPAREQLSTNGPAREQLSTSGPAREQPSSDPSARCFPVAATAERRPPRARRRPGRVVLPIAAAAAVVVAAGVAGGIADTPRPAGQEDDLRATGAVAFGRDGAGALAEPASRRACLARVGAPDPDAVLLGGAPYAVDGTPGTLLVLGTGVTGRYRLLVVDPGCGRILASSTAGR